MNIIQISQINVYFSFFKKVLVENATIIRQTPVVHICSYIRSLLEQCGKKVQDIIKLFIESVQFQSKVVALAYTSGFNINARKEALCL